MTYKAHKIVVNIPFRGTLQRTYWSNEPVTASEVISLVLEEENQAANRHYLASEFYKFSNPRNGLICKFDHLLKKRIQVLEGHVDDLSRGATLDKFFDVEDV